MGLLVGLVAPVLLAPVVVGAAAGAVLGRFAKHKVESGVEEGLGEKLKPGRAAILAIVREQDRLAAERALADSPAKSVATVPTSVVFAAVEVKVSLPVLAVTETVRLSPVNALVGYFIHGQAAF